MASLCDLFQALRENAIYDCCGHRLTGNFVDYGIPRASHWFDIRVGFSEVTFSGVDLSNKGI